MNSYGASDISSLSGLESMGGPAEILLGFGVIFWLILVVVVCVVSLIASAKIFSKAGIAGWKVIVPFYSNYLQYKLVFGNGWLFLLNLIPFVGYVLPCVLEFKLAKVFGKSTGFAILSLFFSPITRLMLGFGNCEYIGPLR